VDGITWLRDPTSGKEVALPGVGEKGGCSDWIIQKGVSDYVLDSGSEVAGVKPRFMKKLLSGKNAREVATAEKPAVSLDPPAAQPTDHSKLLFIQCLFGCCFMITPALKCLIAPTDRHRFRLQRQQEQTLASPSVEASRRRLPEDLGRE
jgi:hypothetical protein